MPNSRFISLPDVLRLLVALLIAKVVGGVVWNYREYMPADFEAPFLQGRAEYFFNGYHWAFYIHILSGPFSLLLGMVLISERFRKRFPRWHRALGRVQVVCVLLLVAPSGLWMSFSADSGAIAGIGFGLLSVVTGFTVACGWRAAVQRQFAVHRRWMLRCFVLLCSAVVLRLMAGMATVANLDGDWIYPLSAWASWLLPLGVYEASRYVWRR